jgi:hypothetical protein
MVKSGVLHASVLASAAHASGAGVISLGSGVGLRLQICRPASAQASVLSNITSHWALVLVGFSPDLSSGAD